MLSTHHLTALLLLHYHPLCNHQVLLLQPLPPGFSAPLAITSTCNCPRQLPPVTLVTNSSEVLWKRCSLQNKPIPRMAFKAFHKLVQLSFLILILTTSLQIPDVSESVQHQSFPKEATRLHSSFLKYLLPLTTYQNKSSLSLSLPLSYHSAFY